jgi:hypothetical protein
MEFRNLLLWSATSALFAAVLALFAAPAQAGWGTGWGNSSMVAQNVGVNGGGGTAILDDGTTFAVWNQGEIWVREYDPLTGWAGQTQVSTGAGSIGEYGMGVSDRNTLFVFWQRGYDVWVRHYSRGVGWSIEDVAVDQDRPIVHWVGLLADPGGNATLVYTVGDPGSRSVWLRQYINGSGWASADSVSNTTDDAFGGAAVPDGAGGVLLAWYQTNATNSTTTVWTRSRMPGAGWSNASSMYSAGTDSVGDLHLAINAAGAGALGFTVRNSTIQTLRVLLLRPGSGWSAAEVLPPNASDWAFYPSLAVEPGGNVTVVWTQGAGAATVQAAMYNPTSGWAPPVIASAPGYGGDVGGVVADGAGNFLVFWRHEGYAPGVRWFARDRGWLEWTVIPGDGFAQKYGGSASAAGAARAVVLWRTYGDDLRATFSLPPFDYDPPTVDAGPNRGAVLDETVFFIATFNDTHPSFPLRLSFIWTFSYYQSPDKVLYGQGSTFVFHVPGVYAVSLVLVDAAGNIANDSFNLDVRDVVPPTIVLHGDFSAFGGQLVHIDADTYDDDARWPYSPYQNWTFLYNGTTTVLTYRHTTFTFWVVGNYSVAINASDLSGNVASATLNIIIVPPDTIAPAAVAGVNTTAVAGVPVPFNGTATDDDPTFPLGATCGWTFDYNGSAQNLTGSNASFVFWVEGAYDVRFYCVDFWGNLGESTMVLTIERPDKQAPVVSAGPDADVNQGTTVSFAGSATDNDPSFPTGAAFWWRFSYNGTNYNISGTDFAFGFVIPGTYRAVLSARDGWGNVGTDEREVVVRDTESPVVPSRGDLIAYVGDTVTFDSNATDNDPAFPGPGSIRWNFQYNGSPVSLPGDLDFAFEYAGTYNLTLVVADAAGNTVTRTFIVKIVKRDFSPPSVDLYADPSTVHAGDVVRFVGTALDSGALIEDEAAFSWTITGNGTTTTLSGSKPSFRFTEPGTYRVTLRVKDDAGNEGNRSLSIIVLPLASESLTSSTLPLIIVAIGVAGAAAAAVVVLRRRKREQPGGPPLTPPP